MTGCKEEKPEKKVPVITITTQPAATTTFTAGSITGSLTVAATVTEGATPGYQWYSNTSASNAGGTVEAGATGASFTIPASLAAGKYYYFCEVSATGGAVAVRSGVATVTVNPPKTFEINVANPEVLAQTIYADETAGFNIDFVATGAWTSAITEGTTAKSTKSETDLWLSIEPDYGADAGEYTIVITLEPNTTGEDRAATIILTCNSEDTTIEISQMSTTESGEVYELPKTVSVGEQEGTLTAETTGTVTFAVTTSNIANGTYSIEVDNLPDGVNYHDININNNAGTLTLNANASAAAGIYPDLTLTIWAGATAVVSEEFTLTISEPESGEVDELPKTVSVGEQVGTLTAETTGTVTFAVTTSNIANGTYSIEVNNLPGGVNYLDININNNAGTLTLNANASAAAGTYPDLTLTISVGATAVVSEEFTLTISEPEVTYFDRLGIGIGPYLIGTALDLAKLAELVNAGIAPYLSASYRLTADIDLNNEEWTPIGTEENPFKGRVDGNGKTVSGLFVNTNIRFAGLFGWISGGGISMLGVEGKVSGGDYAGGLVGYLDGSGSHVRCYANVEVNGVNHVGGLVGAIEGNVFIGNCYSLGSVTGTNNRVGGIAGSLLKGSISNCYATGAISGLGQTGGIVGRMEDGTSFISSCAALNPGVINTGADADVVGRVVGDLSEGSLWDNAAWDRMEALAGIEFGEGISSNKNGANITTGEIKADGTIGQRCPPPDRWITEDGKLPVSFGNPVDLPEHLQ